MIIANVVTSNAAKAEDVRNVLLLEKENNYQDYQQRLISIIIKHKEKKKMNNCKDCGSKLICIGTHPECPDYRKWECPKCKGTNMQEQNCFMKTK